MVKKLAKLYVKTKKKEEEEEEEEEVV